MTKLYYTIGELAKMFGENTSLIRFWEKEFDIIKPQRNKKGNRLFTQQDVDHFHIIYHLVKERGYTLDGAKKKLKTDRKEIDRDLEIAKKLKGIKANLEDMLAQLPG